MKIKIEVETFSREELLELRRRASIFSTMKGISRDWYDAYRALCNAANNLDALMALDERNEAEKQRSEKRRSER